MTIDLDKQSKAIIRNIHLHKEYEVLLLLAEEMIKDIKGAPVGAKPSQWDLTQHTLTKEGQVQGILKFLKTIKLISQNEEKEHNIDNPRQPKKADSA